MANQIPFSGLSDAAGGIVLPIEQGDILTNGVLQEAGALALAGDARATSNRRSDFPIWLGKPTASFVGEAGTKDVTGGEFGAGTLNVKKIASIVLFTDEQIEDLQGGDMNVLVDSGVRDAIADVADSSAIGSTGGSDITGSFDSMLRSTGTSVALGTKGDALALAISEAMGELEAKGYSDLAVLHSADVARHIRDARTNPGGGTANADSSSGLYTPNADPFYGLPRSVSTNLGSISTGPTSGKVVAYVVNRANLHVRIRKDIEVSTSKEATVYDGGQLRNLWQENITGLRYETRLGFFIHDLNRAVVKITHTS